MKGTGLWIHQESVIIAAEFHEPWELTPEFLVERCKVPSTWLCRHSDRSSDQTDIRYGPCHWTMDYDRLWVTEYPDELLLPDAGVTPGDSEEFGSNVSILAHNFLNAVPTLPFRGLRFFWRISAINKEREQWMRESFSPSGWPRDMMVASVQPRLTVVIEDGVFDVSVRNEARQRRGENVPDSTTFDCYVSCREDLSVATALAETGNRTRRLRLLVRVIRQMLGDEDTDVAAQHERATAHGQEEDTDSAG